MKKYNISISSTTNLTSDDKFFLGTGFMGAEFSTMDDLKALLRKYATFEKDGSEFAFILVKGNEVIPQKNKKLRDILRELGIEI